MKLIGNVECYTPKYVGRRDVVVAGGEVLAITPPGSSDLGPDDIDGENLVLIPGLVDALTHPCGGGGEGGFANRTPEIPLEAFVRAGVTTPVGALGTDSIGRSLDVLYGNVMALSAGGLGALMYTGAYRVPAPTLTGDIARDLFLVDPVIGVGEVAIADHRGTQPTPEELRRLGAEASLGGVLCGRGGTVMIHVGDGDSRLMLLHQALAGSDLHPSVFYPTHVNRSRELLSEAAEWARMGGFVDITVSTTPELIAAGDIPAAEALEYLLSAGAPSTQITLSSDGGGSLPVYEGGVLKGLTAARPAVLVEMLAALRARDSQLFELALMAMTVNPANALKLTGRGVIVDGGRADLVMLNKNNGAIEHVLGRGQWLMKDGECHEINQFVA